MLGVAAAPWTAAVMEELPVGGNAAGVFREIGAGHKENKVNGVSGCNRDSGEAPDNGGQYHQCPSNQNPMDEGILDFGHVSPASPPVRP